MLKIYPSEIHGSIIVPPSKSMGHRALICAALSDGKSLIHNVGNSADIETTISVLRKLGATIDVKDNTATITGTNPFETDCQILDCNESGSTLRFMIPVFTLNGNEQTFTGTAKLLSRPLDLYKDIYPDFDLTAERLVIRGPLKPGVFHLDGSLSSQFFTGLLFALPLLESDSKIIIENHLESKSYIEMTISVLKLFGIEIGFKDKVLEIRGKQKYRPIEYCVEGDYSAAAFFELLSQVNKPIEINGLNSNSSQGDRVFFDFAEELKNDHPVFDLKDCPDLGPALMVLACLSGKDVTISSIERLRIKESDRVECMIEELTKFGFDLKADEHSMYIRAREMNDRDDIRINCHNDHRIAMAMSTLATVYTKPVIIEDEKCVRKSYPGFYEDLKHLGVRMEKL